jgi:hypothetical protein
MLGETSGLDRIQGAQHPPGSIPLEIIRAVVMAGIALLEVSPGSASDFYDGTAAYGSISHQFSSPKNTGADSR